MKPITLFLILSGALARPAGADRLELLHADFEPQSTAPMMIDFRQNQPPDSKYGVYGADYLHESEANPANRYYSALDPTFGVAVALKRPYTIHPGTERIEVSARVRCNGKAQTAAIDLTSRSYPDYPFQYSRQLASGFGVKGYQYANEINMLYAYHQAAAPTIVPIGTALAPMNAGRHLWHHWKLIYHHDSKRLTFLLNGQPVKEIAEVDLHGTELRSLWLMGGRAGNDYDDLRVEVLEKKEAP